MEQFLNTTSAELKLWLNEKQPKSLEQMARLADEYLAMRKSFSATNEQSQNSNDIAIVHVRAQKFAQKSVSFENGNKTPPLSRRVGVESRLL